MIRIGIIGTGGMARQHARNFKAAVGCRVAACADIIPGKAKAFAETHGIPASYEDYGEMLAREKLDAVSPCRIAPLDAWRLAVNKARFADCAPAEAATAP